MRKRNITARKHPPGECPPNLQRYKFKPGQSGNPGGKPQGLSAFVKERCGEDGERLIVGLEAIAFGNATDHQRVFGVNRGLRVGVRDRREAISELLDRGFGRPRQALDLDTKQMVPLFALPLGTIVDCGNGPVPGKALAQPTRL